MFSFLTNTKWAQNATNLNTSLDMPVRKVTSGLTLFSGTPVLTM